MRITYSFLLPFAFGIPLSLPERAIEPVYWLLAGDSTTAPSGGWGDAFLSQTVAKGSAGHNYGHSGATTKSFRDGGDWKKVITDVGTFKEKFRVYVTIQVNSLSNSNIFRPNTQSRIKSKSDSRLVRTQ